MPSSKDSRKRRDDYSYLQSPMITVYVGPEQKEFGVHKALICSKSTFFDKACNGQFAQASIRIVRLEHISVTLFSILVSWLYYGRLAYAVPPNSDRNIEHDFNQFMCYDAKMENKGPQEQEQISADTTANTAISSTIGKSVPGRLVNDEPQGEDFKHKTIDPESYHRIPQQLDALYYAGDGLFLLADDPSTWPIDIIAHLYILGDYLDAQHFKNCILDAAKPGKSFDDNSRWMLPFVPSRSLVRLVYKNTPPGSPLRDVIIHRVVHGCVWMDPSDVYEDLPPEFLAKVMVSLGENLTDLLNC
ncbi:hypothetical protein KCU95_g17105, partial [Aureobasidium melanogenum]